MRASDPEPSELADRLGGQAEAPRQAMGVAQHTRHVIHVVVPATRVHVDRDARGDTASVEVFVEAPGSANLGLTLRPGFVYSLVKRLGVQDVALVEPVADERFVVKASDEELAQLWLDEAACVAMTEQPRAAYALSGGTVSAAVSGALSVADAHRLGEIAHIVAERGARVRETWRAAAAALAGRLEVASRLTFLGDLLMRVPAGGDEAVITVEHAVPDRLSDLRTLYTRVGVRRRDVHDGFVVARDGVKGLPRPGARRQVHGTAGFHARGEDPARDPSPLAAALAEVGGNVFHGEPEELSLWLRGHVIDAERLGLAARLTAGFATARAAGPAGPYR